MHWRRKWQPTPVSLPGESQGRGACGLTSMGSHRVRHDWSDLAAAGWGWDEKGLVWRRKHLEQRRAWTKAYKPQEKNGFWTIKYSNFPVIGYGWFGPDHESLKHSAQDWRQEGEHPRGFWEDEATQSKWCVRKMALRAHCATVLSRESREIN